MANIPNPPQFNSSARNDGTTQFTGQDFYKLKQFVEEMIRAMRQLDSEVQSLSGGGGSGIAGRSYPPQLGHSGI